MLKAKTVLVIDPHRSDLSIIQSELVRLGYIVVAVNHPSQVEAVLEAMDRVDVIFLDLEMPSQDDYATLQTLRDMGITIPIIAYTVDVDELQQIRRAGFNGLIAKPLDIDHFGDVLDEILAGEKGWLT